MRHSEEVVKKIIALRKGGATLGEILAHTNLPKTTIYHHIQSVPVTERIRKKKLAHILRWQRSLANSRRGISLKPYKVVYPGKWEPELVNTVAHFIFDGSIRQKNCLYYNRNKQLIEAVRAGVEKYFAVGDPLLSIDNNDVFRLAFNNVELAPIVKEKAQILLKQVVNMPKEHKRAFLRAFFDDEGCIYVRNRSKRVRGYQHNIKILKLIKTLLGDFGIKAVITSPVEIFIAGKENLVRFAREINFSPNLRVNGKRSNSRWKRSLEKRKILEMALASYQN